MAAEVKILVEGKTNADSIAETGEERTQPTITLVRDGDTIMVVDPGILDSQQVLIDALARENLMVDDVNVVCITHSHLDHYRNIGMFPKAKTLEYYGLWDKNTIENWTEFFTDSIKIFHTPGHDYTGITIFVTTGPESKHPGVVAICGDIFWKNGYPRDPKNDVFASNPEKLKESRDMICRMADWIIPGHGPIYKNDRNTVHFWGKTEETHIEPKIIVKCKKCRSVMRQHDKCQCRPYLCFRCCLCGFDCPACGCSHKK